MDIRAINMIANLLTRKIPVAFITGRGENGLLDFKSDIYENIFYNSKITSDDLKRVHVLTNDGARLFYSYNVSKNDFLTKSIYISTQEELAQLKEVDDEIKKLSSDKYKISYSKDSKNNAILNIRLVFDIKESKEVGIFFEALNNFIITKNYNDVHLTRGMYKSKSVIQIGTTKKNIAIDLMKMGIYCMV